MKIIIPFLAAIFLCNTSFAEMICVSTAKEFEELKEKMPALFRELPIKLGADMPGNFYDVFVAIEIKLRGDAIVLGTDSWKGPLGRYKDEVEIRKVCFNTEINEMIISFKPPRDRPREAPKDFKGIYSASEVKVTDPKVTLKKITNAEEKAILDKISRKAPADSDDRKSSGVRSSN